MEKLSTSNFVINAVYYRTIMISKQQESLSCGIIFTILQHDTTINHDLPKPENSIGNTTKFNHFLYVTFVIFVQFAVDKNVNLLYNLGYRRYLMRDRDMHMDTNWTIKVYHGTTSVRASVVCKTRKFNLSSADDEWLGTGIYFWSLWKDARWWAKNHSSGGYKPAILTVGLTFDPLRYCDLDDPAQMQKFEQEMAPVLKAMGADGYGAAEFKNSHEKTKWCCDYYKVMNNLELMAYTFPVHPDYERVQTNSLGFAYTSGRKQYCATNNDIISSIAMEVDDYAV